MPYSRYYRSRLTDIEKAAYDAVCGGIERRASGIAFPAAAKDSLDRIIFAVKYDNPLYFYVDYDVRLILRQEAGPWSLPAQRREGAGFAAPADDGWSGTLQVSYRLTKSQIREDRERIEREARAVAAGTAGLTPAAKALYLHDRLVRRCSYGEPEGAKAGAHTIAGALLDNTCVCEGYAMAFKHLADLAGLRCTIVAGEGIHPDGSRGPHAWNLVKTEGRFSHIDVTFDSLLADRYCSHAYFCLSDDQILSDHSVDSRFPVPPCSGGQSFLPVVSGTGQLVEFMKQEAFKGASFSEVRLTRGFPADELIEKVHSRLTVEDYEWYRRLDSYSFANNCRVLSLIWR